MTFFRRSFLLIIVLVVPMVVTAFLYVLTIFGLHATNRVIDPQILRISAAVEYAVFLFTALLEARSRW